MVNTCIAEFLRTKDNHTLSSLSALTTVISNRSSSKIIDYIIDNRSSDEDSDEENLYSANSISDVLNNRNNGCPRNNEPLNILLTSLSKLIRSRLTFFQKIGLFKLYKMTSVYYFFK